MIIAGLSRSRKAEAGDAARPGPRDDVFIALVSGLFEMMPSLVMSVIAVALVSAKVAFVGHNPISWGIFAVALTSGCGRIGIALAFAKRLRLDRSLTKAEAVRWERLFALYAWLFATAAGAMIFVTLTQIDDLPDHILVNAIGCGVAAGVTSRNAGSAWIAKGQILILIVPIIVASIMRMDVNYVMLAVLNMLFLVANLDIVDRFNRQMVDLVMARRAQERTLELERLNVALALARASADAANTSKTRFLAAASHDLLQPLNAARLYAASLREKMDARAGYANDLALAMNVEASLEAVEDIINALLDISRLDAGAITTEISAFRVDDVFRQLRLEFEPIAVNKGLDLRFVPSTLPVVSDIRLLRRLLRNLVSNAIKYTTRGRILVGVRQEPRHARIEVWDTGIGIAADKQRDIFREFERLPNAIATAPGVGLGLSIVERVAEILDHDVTVRSEPDRGSVFAVTLRREPIFVFRNAVSHVEDRQPLALDGLVVAVIDNDPGILAGMAALLAGWKCQVLVGDSYHGIEAALLAADVVPDLIFADYHLDEGDGIAVVESLRERFGPCRAALVTADRGDRVRDLAQDRDIRVLNKPIKPASLRALLAQLRLRNEAVAE